MNTKKVLFVAGVYGVGKTTISNEVSKKMSIPVYTASELISHSNGEIYGANKTVADINGNQYTLINAVNNVLENNGLIILNGHFCILGKKGEVEALPEFVFEKIHLSCIILLEADCDTIWRNLSNRDGKKYELETLELLKRQERESAFRISELFKKKIFVHKMKFDDSDAQLVTEFIRGII